MSITSFKVNVSDVTDPSDFKSTKIPALSELDNLERCYICKEFFRAPVITTCNHTFCSQCIREYLITNNSCPLCKTEVFESTLKRDVLLEEVVSCYVSLRPFLLKFLKGEKSGEADNSKTNEVNRKRVFQEEVIEISDSEAEVEQLKDTSKRRKSESPAGSTSPQSEDLVCCPVCSMQMSAEVLQTSHLDDCLSGKVTKKYTAKPKKKQPRNSISSFFKPRSLATPSASSSSTPPEKLGNEAYYFQETSRHNSEVKRLPKLDFSSLITPKLKEKLAAINLPTHGNRNQLELRYNQYFVLYNSNLDSNRPVSEKILRQKLNQWELSHREFNSYNGDLFSNHQRGISNRSITDKNFSVSEWMQEYKQDFKELVKIARASAKKTRTTDTADKAVEVEVAAAAAAAVEIVEKSDSYNSDITVDAMNDNLTELPQETTNDSTDNSGTAVSEKITGEEEIKIADLDFALSPLFSDAVGQK